VSPPRHGSAESAPAAPKPIAGPGRPDEYRTLDGKRVPSVTTITGRFKSAGALLAWANREGLEGRSLDEARDAAADAGHVAHQWIQDRIHGRDLTAYPFGSDETLEKATRALEAFGAWSSEVGLVVLCTEVPVVHEALRYGGTPDGVGLVEGRPMLLDWKTGNRTYPEHLIQLAAYRELLRDARGRLPEAVEPPNEGVLIRCDKETGTPHARIFEADALDLAWDYFEGALRLYRLDQAVGKMVAERKPRGKAA